MDATVTNIHNKSDEELKLLYREGVRRLYLGIESGLDDVLLALPKKTTRWNRHTGKLSECGAYFQRAHYDRYCRKGPRHRERGKDRRDFLTEPIRSESQTFRYSYTSALPYTKILKRDALFRQARLTI